MYSFAADYNSVSIGTAALAMGYYAKAGAQSGFTSYDTAIGYQPQALGGSSMSIGYYTIANGFGSWAGGNNAKTGGSSSVSIGVQTFAGGGGYNFAGDYNAVSTGFGSISLGYYSIANQSYAVAVGNNAKADRSSGVNLASFVSVGDNNLNGLSTGDINASGIYYTALHAKSPSLLCDTQERCMAIDFDLKQINWCDKGTGEWRCDTPNAKITAKLDAIDLERQEWATYESRRDSCEADGEHGYSLWSDYKTGARDCFLDCQKANKETDGRGGCQERTTGTTEAG
jgi:hypothetical protein